MTDKLHPAVLRAAAIIETHQFVQKETAIIFDRETHYTELVEALRSAVTELDRLNSVVDGQPAASHNLLLNSRALLDRIEKGT